MNDTERIVTEELKKYGLRCDHFSKSEMRKRKTPDFRVYRAQEFAFFLEVKEIAQDNWLYGSRPDPIFNRLTDDIYTAVKQFDSVNPALIHPNIMAFVNNDRMCDSLDLIGVLTGHLLLESGGTAPVYLSYSEGRIRDKKNRIHLYLWFDSFKASKVFFNKADGRHFMSLCTSFGFDPDSIKEICR